MTKLNFKNPTLFSKLKPMNIYNERGTTLSFITLPNKSHGCLEYDKNMTLLMYIHVTAVRL